MKSLFIILSLMTAVMLDADNTSPEHAPELKKLPEKIVEVRREDDQLVVITDVEFVPFSQYLGLPDINNLPPTSAGISGTSQQRAQHRAP